MFQDTIFAQIMKLIDHNEFNRCVIKYDGNKYIKDFSCYDHFLFMLFSQLASKKSMRASVLSLNIMNYKLYHMGFRCKNISLNNLSYANNSRNWRIFYDYAQSLIKRAKELYINESFDLDVPSNIYAFDSTIIDLCLSVFNWAIFRSTKAGIKLHTLLDIKTNIPLFIDITHAIMSDVKKLDDLIFEINAIYIIDRAYLDFLRLRKIKMDGAFFIIRQKSNTRLRRVYSYPVDKSTGLKYDQAVQLCSRQSLIAYPEKLRRIKFIDPETGKKIILLTNNFELPALMIAVLYKKRWQIELFFKWIKQNLHIEKFFGESENAVKLQVWIAISAYLLVAILKKELDVKESQYEILHFLSDVLFEQSPIGSLLTNSDYKIKNTDLSNQLSILDF